MRKMAVWMAFVWTLTQGVLPAWGQEGWCRAVATDRGLLVVAAVCYLVGLLSGWIARHNW